MNKISQELITFDEAMIKYISAQKVLETQLEIINDSFVYIKNYNPIEHIASRIKSKESIFRKLNKLKLEFTLQNIDQFVKDVVGIRIICSFLPDVYDLIAIIKNSNIIRVIEEKDYITTPKESGYRSYHIIVEVPVELIHGKEYVKAEIQIRTLAMDLWASLNHKLSYKSRYCTEEIDKRLWEVSNELNQIDKEMTDLVNKELAIKEQRLNERE